MEIKSMLCMTVNLYHSLLKNTSFSFCLLNFSPMLISHLKKKGKDTGKEGLGRSTPSFTLPFPREEMRDAPVRSCLESQLHSSRGS